MAHHDDNNNTEGGYYLGLLCLLLSLCCLGTWPALLRLCSSSSTVFHLGGDDGCGPTTSFWRLRQEQERPPRNICHIYLDYSTAYVLVSCLPLLLLSWIGNGSNDNNDNSSNNNSNNNNRDTIMLVLFPWPLILVSMMGGALLSLGNLSLQWATAVYQAPLTTVVAIQASMTVVLGTFINFLLEPSKTPHPHLLLAGVVAYLFAIALAMRAQLLYSSSASSSSSSNIRSTGPILSSAGQFESSSSERGIEIKPWRLTSNPVENTTTNTTNETMTQQPLKKVAVDDVSIGQQAQQRVDQVIAPWPEKPTTTAAAAADSTISSSLLRLHYRHHQSYNSHHGDDDDHSCTITNNNNNPKASLTDNKNEEAESNEKQDDDDQQDATVIGHADDNNDSNNSIRGLIIATCGGLCFGFFSPAFNIAVNDPFHWAASSSSGEPQPQQQQQQHQGMLVLTRANAWFSFAFWIMAVVGNLLLLCRQHQRRRRQQEEYGLIHGHDDHHHHHHVYHHSCWGQKVHGAVSLLLQVVTEYLCHGDGFSSRQLAIMTGVVCALGNVLQFMGGQFVGYATADLVQAFPIISTIWDVYLFGEFSQVQFYSWLGFLLVAMYVAYIAGIVLLFSSSLV